MATMTLPMNMLGAVIVEAERAQADTKSVVSVSLSAAATTKSMVMIARKTFSLRRMYARIVADQDALLDKITSADLCHRSASDLLALAKKIDALVERERDVLGDAEGLSVTIRYWWGESLLKMAEQVEHFDSIAESLHASSDPELNALMAFSVGRMAAAS